MHSILRYQRKFGSIHPTDMFNIFDSMVKPILCYTSKLSGYVYNKRVESVHIKICKRYCLLNKHCMDAIALSECGRLPLCITCMSNCIKYWIRLLHLNSQRYPKQLEYAGRTTWATHIKLLPFTHDFGYVWIVQAVSNFALFRQRLIDCYAQKIHYDITSSSRCDHYQHYKSLSDVEQYLSVNLNYMLKTTFANFRCSSHGLMIEKGRHLNIDREYRYCLSLDLHVIEDEMHFFLECVSYEQIREQYFPSAWSQNRSLANF